MYAVIFSSTLSADTDGYDATAARMEELCREQPGFRGIDHARGADGHGITVCLWDTLDDIAAWRADLEHTAAREQGIARWYESYSITICEVLRGHDGGDGSGAVPG